MKKKTNMPYVNNIDAFMQSMTVKQSRLGHVAQSVTSLATDVSLTADPGVASSIPARSHTSWRLIMK